MAASGTTSAAEPELTSERVAGGMLPRVLNSVDMVVIFVAIVLFVSNVPGIYGNGPVSILYFFIGFVTFLVPGAIVTGQLGRLFPGEGSIYLWTHKAFGPFASFFAGFVAWWPGVLVLVGSGTVVSQLLQYIGSWTFPPWLQGVIILAVVVVAAAVASLRLPGDPEPGQRGLRPLRSGHPAGRAGRRALARAGPSLVRRLPALRRGARRLVPGPEHQPPRPDEHHVHLEHLRLRGPGPARRRGPAEHGRRDRAREGHHAVPALGLRGRDGRLPDRHLGAPGRGRPQAGRQPGGPADTGARDHGPDPVGVRRPALHRRLPVQRGRIQLLVRAPALRLRARPPPATGAEPGQPRQDPLRGDHRPGGARLHHHGGQLHCLSVPGAGQRRGPEQPRLPGVHRRDHGHLVQLHGVPVHRRALRHPQVPGPVPGDPDRPSRGLLGLRDRGRRRELLRDLDRLHQPVL